MKSTHLVYLLCCLECFVTVNSVIIDYNNPTVVTSYGTVKGRTLDGISSINRRYVQFIGVPYARPPTGSDRFQVIVSTLKDQRLSTLLSFNLVTLQNLLQSCLHWLIHTRILCKDSVTFHIS